jgi:hypothetical protein
MSTDHEVTMRFEIISFIRRHTRQLAALAIAPGLLALAFDAGVAHYVGRAGDHPAQSAPIIFGVAGALAVIAGALASKRRRIFAWCVRVVGVASIIVGAAGTLFHGLALFELLVDKGFTWDGVENALYLAPPALAPSAFIGIGVVLWMLGSKSLRLAYRLKHAPAAVAMGAMMLIATPASAAEHKNLQVLKSSGDVDKGMKELAKGLGVKCEACHVKGKFESDDVAAKVQAREFLKLTVGEADPGKRDAALGAMLTALSLKEVKQREIVWSALKKFEKR